MAWRIPLALAPGDQPVFVRIAEAVVGEIRRGRLVAGDPLPGTRRVAEQLGVHRNTVLAAWSELRAQGWIETRPGAATRVASLPVRPAARTRPHESRLVVPRVEAPVVAAPAPPGTLVMAGGQPDLRSFPVVALARAWRSALRHTRGRLLSYGDPRGHARLRTALATMLAAERGLAVGADDLVVTRGSQQALYLLARTLLRPGDRVAVEALGYAPGWAALRTTGAELVPIDVDAGGLRVDQVRDAARAGRLKAVYVTPHHQFPTMVTLTAARRLELLALAAEHRIAIIEDDYDNEFHFSGKPVLPLAARDEAGVVAYVGTLSKTLAPGLRLGFVAAPAPVLDALTVHRLAVDRQGDLATEYALAMLFEDGTVLRHLRRMRRTYGLRQHHLVEALRRGLDGRLAFDVPQGGLALWARALTTDPEAWSARALAEGVGFEAGRRFHVHGRALPFMRLGFASLDEDQLDRAVEVLARTCGP